MAKASQSPIFIGDDMVVELDGLFDSVDKAFENAATLTFTLRDSAKAAVFGATDVAMSYVAASDGIYQGTIEDVNTAALTEGDTYWVDIDMDAGSDQIGLRRIKCIAQYHGRL